MAGLFRYKIFWQGVPGGLGNTTLYAAEAVGTPQGFSNDASGFMSDALTSSGGHNLLPVGVVLHPDSVVDHLDGATGKLTGSSSVSPTADIVGSGAGPWAAAAGGCITLNTDDFILGHRLRGRTYLVPLSNTAFDATGTLSGACIIAFEAAVTQMLGKPCDWSVWHRPTTKGGSDGHFSSVTSGTVRDKSAILTSRRD